MNLFFTLFFAFSQAFQANPGAALELADVAENSVPVNTVKIESSKDCEVILFFDALDPNALNYLRMLDSLRFFAVDSKRDIKFFAVARNSKKLVSEVIGSARLAIPVGADESKKVFAEFAAAEIMLPVAYVIEKGKIRWKGAPADIQEIIRKIFDGSFSFSEQLRIDILKRDLQSALRASLPDVIIKTADSILAIRKDEMTAIQAKLFVYENTRRSADAMDFLRKTHIAVPENIDLTLLYLDSLARNNRRTDFSSEITNAFNNGSMTLEARLRLAAFALDNTPFGWLPAPVFIPFAERLALETAANTAYPDERRAFALECGARARLVKGDFDGALEFQKQAAELRKGGEFETDAQALVKYYETLQSLKK